MLGFGEDNVGIRELFRRFAEVGRANDQHNPYKQWDAVAMGSTPVRFAGFLTR